MTTAWWLVVLAIAVSVAFSAGFVAHAEWVLWLRSQHPYQREITLTHTSRGAR